MSRWTKAHEAALQRAAQNPQPAPRSRAVDAQRERRAREDLANPPSAEVLAQRAYKAASRAKALDPMRKRERIVRADPRQHGADAPILHGLEPQGDGP